MPAAPAPDIAIRTVPSFLPTTRSALVSAASTTIAVPCWSSWKTGMSSRSRSRRSTSKHRGALMSSRLMPAEARARSPGRCARSRRCPGCPGTPARRRCPANRLNSAALPSITGSAAYGPMLPRPSTAEPSVTTATLFRLMVSLRTSSGLRGDGHGDPGHPGRVGHGQVVPVAQRHLDRGLDLPAQVQQEGPVADLAQRHAVDRAQRLHDRLGVLGVPGRAGHVHPEPLVPERGDVQGGDRAAGLLHRRG